MQPISRSGYSISFLILLKLQSLSQSLELLYIHILLPFPIFKVVEIITLGVLIHADSGDNFITVKKPGTSARSYVFLMHFNFPLGLQPHLFFF